MTKQILLLALFGCLLYVQGSAQSPGTESPALTQNPEGSNIAPKKGTLFITPFYEFTRFQKLELISNTNYYHFWDQESSEELSGDIIDRYNNTYGTEYMNSLVGIKIGYEVLHGLGIGGHIGISHFNFKSFMSGQNTQSISTDYPALTLGPDVNYNRKITEHFSALALASFNYCTTSSTIYDNTSGMNVISSSIKSVNYEFNLALSYNVGHFVPYAGAGFSEQYVNSVSSEQVPTTDDSGNPVFNVVEFDSQFKGNAFYGFAGIEYLFSQRSSIYLRSSFPNPLRANLGFRIIL